MANRECLQAASVTTTGKTFQVSYGPYRVARLKINTAGTDISDTTIRIRAEQQELFSGLAVKLGDLAVKSDGGATAGTVESPYILTFDQPLQWDPGNPITITPSATVTVVVEGVAG